MEPTSVQGGLDPISAHDPSKESYPLTCVRMDQNCFGCGTVVGFRDLPVTSVTGNAPNTRIAAYLRKRLHCVIPFPPVRVCEPTPRSVAVPLFVTGFMTRSAVGGAPQHRQHLAARVRRVASIPVVVPVLGSSLHEIKRN